MHRTPLPAHPSLTKRGVARAQGEVVLQLKTPYRDGTTHLVMAPLEFLQRLAALVPRPRLHVIRFHGVLAPNAALRARLSPVRPTSCRRPLKADSETPLCLNASPPELGSVAQTRVPD